jgi:predicted nuclease of predicted toxin-antitoxin system
MKIYLDDNSYKAILAAMLQKAGHSVVIPSAVGRAGVADARHFIYVIENDLVILTKDYEDFLDLHDVAQALHGQHPGILAVRCDNDASRDMKDRDIIRAIGNLERAGIPIINEFHVLNHWR